MLSLHYFRYFLKHFEVNKLDISLVSPIICWVLLLFISLVINSPCQFALLTCLECHVFDEWIVLHQRHLLYVIWPLLWKTSSAYFFSNKSEYIFCDLAGGGHYFSKWSALIIMKTITLAPFSWSCCCWHKNTTVKIRPIKWSGINNFSQYSTNLHIAVFSMTIAAQLPFNSILILFIICHLYCYKNEQRHANSTVFTDYKRLLSEHTVNWIAACMLMPFQTAFVSYPPLLDVVKWFQRFKCCCFIWTQLADDSAFVESFSVLVVLEFQMCPNICLKPWRHIGLKAALKI